MLAFHSHQSFEAVSLLRGGRKSVTSDPSDPTSARLCPMNLVHQLSPMSVGIVLMKAVVPHAMALRDHATDDLGMQRLHFLANDERRPDAAIAQHVQQSGSATGSGPSSNVERQRERPRRGHRSDNREGSVAARRERMAWCAQFGAAFFSPNSPCAPSLRFSSRGDRVLKHGLLLLIGVSRINWTRAARRSSQLRILVIEI